jgi:hypothetical protein
MNSFGFIMTRHVNSETTNRYWNHSVKLLRTFYPERKIIIIDDNSNQNFVKADFDYKNVEIIQSAFPGRGELLPYYYYLKNKYFDNAVILHDSVFIHRRINFRALNGMKVLPLWHFNSDNENVDNSAKIISRLQNPHILYDKLKNELTVGLPNDIWYGCFGVQSYINHDFLLHIEQKYKITNMISNVLCRNDRCCLERIMGCIFYTESPKILKMKSFLGDITKHVNWRKYTFDKYSYHLKKGTIPSPVVKVWSGR